MGLLCSADVMVLGGGEKAVCLCPRAVEAASYLGSVLRSERVCCGDMGKRCSRELSDMRIGNLELRVLSIIGGCLPRCRWRILSSSPEAPESRQGGLAERRIGYRLGGLTGYAGLVSNNVVRDDDDRTSKGEEGREGL